MKKIINNIKNWFKNATKTRASRFALFSSILSFFLLIGVTTAWFVSIVNVPNGELSTGYLGVIAKYYDAQGNEISFDSTTDKQNVESLDTVFNVDKLFTENNLGVDKGTTFFISLELDRQGEGGQLSLDVEYSLTFQAYGTPENLNRLGSFFYRVRVVDNSYLDYQKHTKYTHSNGEVNGTPVPNYDPRKIDYSGVISNYVTAHPEEQFVPLSKDKENCTEKDPFSDSMINIGSNSKDGVLTKPDVPLSNSHRHIIQVDVGVTESAQDSDFTNVKIGLNGQVHATQVGALDHPEGEIRSIYVYDQRSLREAIDNLIPGSSIHLANDITYNGDLIIKKCISIYTDGRDLTVNGNFIYDYVSPHALTIQMSKQSSIFVNKIGDAGGDLIINAPKSDINILGVPYSSMIYVDKGIDFNGSRGEGATGVRLSGIGFVDRSGANSKTIKIGSNTRLIVDKDVKLADVMSEPSAVNIDILNYGVIGNINLSEMHVLKNTVVDNPDHFTDEAQIYIHNFRTIEGDITLPDWSVKFVGDPNPGKSTGNTTIKRAWNSSDLNIINPNQEGFQNDDIELDETGNEDVVEVKPDEEYIIYYRDPKADKVVSIRDVLYEYYTRKKGEVNQTIFDSWVAKIQRLTIITLDDKVVTNNDINYINTSFTGLKKLDLTKTYIEGNILPPNAFANNGSITSVLLPETINEIGADAFLNTKILEITIPASVNKTNEACDHIKFITIKGNNPNIMTNPKNLVNSYVFVDPSNVSTFRNAWKVREPKMETRVYQYGILCDEGRSVVRRKDNGKYELVVYAPVDKIPMIQPGSGLKIDGNPITIESVGEYCFTNIDYIFNIKFDFNIHTIGSKAFYNSLVNKIDFVSVDEIQSQAFYNCKYLNSSELETDGTTGLLDFKKVTNIYAHAFENCESLFEIKLPNVTYIGEYAFTNCNNLSFVEFGALKECRDGAFYNSNADSYVYRIKFNNVDPAMVNIPGLKPLLRTKFFTSKENIDLLQKQIPDMPVFIDGIIVGQKELVRNINCRDGDSLNAIKVACKRNVGEYVLNFLGKFSSYDKYEIVTYNTFDEKITLDYTVPDLIKETIYDEHGNLNGVISRQIVSVGNFAYFHTKFGNGPSNSSTDMINLSFANGIVKVHKGAFANSEGYNKSIKNIYFNNVTDIYEGAFYNINNLETIDRDANNHNIIGNKIERIYGNAFEGCTSLTTVELPNLISFEADDLNKSNVFKQCSNLVIVRIGSKFLSFKGADPFEECFNLRKVYIESKYGVKGGLSLPISFDSRTFRAATSKNLKLYLTESQIENNSNIPDSVAGFVYEFGDKKTLGTYEVTVKQNGRDVIFNIGLYDVIRNKKIGEDYINAQEDSGLSICSYNVDLDQIPVDYRIPNEIEGLPVKRIGYNSFARLPYGKFNKGDHNNNFDFASNTNLVEVGPRAFYKSRIRVSDLNKILYVDEEAFSYTDIYMINAPELLWIGNLSFANIQELRVFEAQKLKEAADIPFDNDNKLVKIITDLVSIGQLFNEDLLELREITFGITEATNDVDFPINENYIYFTSSTNANNFKNSKPGIIVYDINDPSIYRLHEDTPNSGNYVVGENTIPVEEGNVEIYSYTLADLVVKIINIEEQNSYGDIITKEVASILKNYQYNVPEDYNIPSFINIGTGYTVYRLAAYSFRLTKFANVDLSLPIDIKQIGYSAFGFTNLSQEVNTNFVTLLEGNTFEGTNIVRARLPKLLTTYGYEFLNCKLLNQVIIGTENETAITKLPMIFKGCTNLKVVQFNNNVSLKAFTTPSGKEIPQEDFKDCTNLAIIFDYYLAGEYPDGEFPSAVGWNKVSNTTFYVYREYDNQFIDQKVFTKNGNHIEYYGDSIISGAYTIYLKPHSNKPGWIITDGNWQEWRVTKVIKAENPTSNDLSFLEIPADAGVPITSIEHYALDSAIDIKTIQLSQNYQYYDDGSFAGLSKLKNINVNSANKYFSSNNGVLYDKNQTVLYYYPAAKKGENTNIYYYDKEIEFLPRRDSVNHYKIASTVQVIVAGAFENVKGINCVYIPKGIKIMGANLFNGSNIKVIRFMGAEPPIVLSSTLFSAKDIRVYCPSGQKEKYAANSAFSNTKVKNTTDPVV